MSDDNVVNLDCVTRLPLKPERVLNGALKAGLKFCVVVGESEDGVEYFASTISDGPEVLWALERAKLKLLRMVDPNAEAA